MYRYIIAIFALVGIVTMGYLTMLHYDIGKGESFCDISDEVSCEIVNVSEYSEVLGIPVAVLGIFFFGFILFISLKRFSFGTIGPAELIFLLAIVMLIPSLYLTWTEIFLIGSICILCEFSKALMVIMLLLAFLWARKEQKTIAKNAIIAAVVLGFVFFGVAYASHHLLDFKKVDYTEFAQCLDEKGYVVYGSETCAYCARQRALFGEEVFHEYITEIECDPRNEGYVEGACLDDIEKTPTWVQEDEEGNILYRFEAGLQSMEHLSDVSGCPLPGSEDLTPADSTESDESMQEQGDEVMEDDSMMEEEGAAMEGDAMMEGN